MRLALSPDARNDALNAIRDRIGLGGTLEIYAGPLALGVLLLSSPCAPDAAGGVLTFGPIADENTASHDGVPNRALIISGAGNEVIECDVGGEDSDAVLKLDDTDIKRGGRISVRSFAVSLA